MLSQAVVSLRKHSLGDLTVNRQLITCLALCISSSGLAAEPVRQSSSLNVKIENGAADKTISQSLFWYKADLLNGHAEKEPLEKVLAELSKTSGLDYVLKYKPEEEETVTFRIQGKTLADSLKEVLTNYNYVFIPAANAGEASKLILLRRVFEEAEEPELMLEEELPGVASDSKPAEPWSLDEFQKLESASRENMTPEQWEALEREEREQKMNRALDALDTEHRGLKEDAIGELMGVDNPEATDALLNTALNGEDTGLQQFAAEALWRHAADLEFKNPQANQALQTLAEKGDAITKEYARKALEDARRYAKNAGEDGGG